MPLTRIYALSVTLLCWLGHTWTAWAQAPSVATTFPQDKAENLDCHFALTATLRFPSEADNLDPITLTPQNVRLYPLGQPDSSLFTDLDYNQKEQYLNLTCLQVLKPQQTYVFEITNGLADNRGFTFLPYRLTFTTGDCERRSSDVLAELRPQARLDPEEIKTVMREPQLTQLGDSLQIRWQTEQEFMSQYFWVERARNDSGFEAIGKVVGVGESQQAQRYFWLDADLPPGAYRYRILAVDQLGRISISDTVSVFQNGIALEQRVLPMGGSLSLEFVQAAKTTMVAVFYNRERQIVKRNAGFVEAGWQRKEIELEGLAPGDYILVVQTPDRRLVEPIRVVKP